MKITRRGESEFDLVDGHDVPAKIESVGVVAEDRLIWWVVLDEYSETWTPRGRVEFLDDRAADVTKQLKAHATKSGGRSLARITYGKVPQGFRQVTPERGRPPKLQPGARYVLHVVGRDFETLEFEF